jgi:hypothetical protein
VSGSQADAWGAARLGEWLDGLTAEALAVENLVGMRRYKSRES